jgi:hypothetical protein
VIGVHPGPFTLRQLWAMGAAVWEPWGELLAMFFNANKPKEVPAEPGETFNPYARSESRQPTIERLDREESKMVLKALHGGS